MLTQVDKTHTLAVEKPKDALPGKGGVNVSFRKKLSNGLGGVTSDRVSISVSATTLGTASLSSIPDLTLTWIIPIFIGLLFGLVPWVLFLYKRRGEPTPTIGKGLHAAQEQDGIDYSQGEIPTDHSH